MSRAHEVGVGDRVHDGDCRRSAAGTKTRQTRMMAVVVGVSMAWVGWDGLLGC